jgi:hypothetical protein
MGLVMTCLRIKACADVASSTCTIAKECFQKITLPLAVCLVALVIALLVLVFYYIPRIKRSSIRKSQFKDKNGNVRCSHFVNRPRRERFEMIKAGSNQYKVHEDLDNPEQAAQTMDQLNTVALELINHLDVKYLQDPSGYRNIKPEYWSMIEKGIKATKNNYNTANLEENIPERSGGDTSYVIDKGDVFAMCLRDPTNGNKIDPKTNDLIFVLIHEIGHLFCSDWGHSDRFWNNFKFLLQEATEAGLYTPVDYKSNGSPYCGIVITYSPLYDPNLLEYHSSQTP